MINDAIFFVVYNFKHCILTESRMERDNFMTPTEAKDFGLIDKVLAHPMQEETAEANTEKTSSIPTQL